MSTKRLPSAWERNGGPRSSRVSIKEVARPSRRERANRRGAGGSGSYSEGKSWEGGTMTYEARKNQGIYPWWRGRTYLDTCYPPLRPAGESKGGTIITLAIRTPEPLRVRPHLAPKAALTRVSAPERKPYLLTTSIYSTTRPWAGRDRPEAEARGHN